MRMLRFLVFLCVVFPLSLTQAESAFAQETQAFMVIRFNQPRMYYDQSLYNAVARAVQLKQDVMFEAVAYAPATGNKEADARWNAAAREHLAQVVARMGAIGVPQSRIMTSIQQQQGLKFDEVHLFAR